MNDQEKGQDVTTESTIDSQDAVDFMQTGSSNEPLLSVQREEHTHNEGLFLATTEIRVIDENQHGVVTESRSVKIELSVHAQAAVEAFKMSVRDDLICVALSTTDGKPSFEDIATRAGQAMAKEFATSVVTDQLSGTFGDGARTVASGAVLATYALLHGDREAAVKVAVDSAANFALEKMQKAVLGNTLPISYGSSTTAARANFFGLGQRIEQSVVESDRLSISPTPGISIGIGFDRESTVYSRDGRRLHLEASLVPPPTHTHTTLTCYNNSCAHKISMSFVGPRSWTAGVGWSRER